MSETADGKARPDRWTYVKNRSKFLPDNLLPYAGQWLAWSADGSRIVAHHEDLLEVAAQVKAAGLDSEDVNLEYMPPGWEN